MVYIVADIGGTKTRLASSRDLKTFEEPIILDTPPKYTDGLSAIVQRAKDIAGGEAVEAVSLALSGVIIADKKTTHKSNLSDWDGRAIGDDIGSALGAEAYLLNDTATVGIGESLFGAGRGAAIVVYMTVSTGVNAVRIVNGVPDHSVYGSETGDQYMLIDNKPEQLGNIISGTAVSRKYGIPPRELGKDSPVWEELARFTAFGLYNSIVHWSPERVVLGGSMFNEIGISVDRVAAHLATINVKYPTLPEIVHSELGDLGGLWGGLARLKQLT